MSKQIGNAWRDSLILVGLVCVLIVVGFATNNQSQADTRLVDARIRNIHVIRVWCGARPCGIVRLPGIPNVGHRIHFGGRWWRVESVQWRSGGLSGSVMITVRPGPVNE